MKIDNIVGENLPNDMRTFFEISRKDVTFENIKSYRKKGLQFDNPPTLLSPLPAF